MKKNKSKSSSMSRIVVAVTIVVALLEPCVAVQQYHFVEDTSSPDRTCSSVNVLFSVNQTTKIACGLACGNDKCCSGFSYRKLDGKCVGCQGGTISAVPTEPGMQFYETLNPECSLNWKKVFANDVDGGVVFGDRGELIEAVTSGSDVRIVYGNFATSLQNVQPHEGHLCGQSLFILSKQTYDTFKADVYWFFINVCTTGHFNMARYNVGEHISRSDSTTNKAVEWFVRPRCSKSPLYSVNSQGTVLHGSVADVIAAVKNGRDIRITSSTSSYTFPADYLTFDGGETEVTAQALWHVSQRLDVDNYIFEANAYWWFTIWSTSATRHISKWRVGEHTTLGATGDVDATDWFSDPCWRLVYRHDDQGNAIEGSLTDLVSAINQGHRVRVFYSTNIIAATEINIRNGHVSATLIDSISKADLSHFKGNDYWFWRVASTTGTIHVTRYRVGINTLVTGTTVTSKAISWFVDTRPWSKVLTVGSDGTVTSGSKADLVHAIRNGAELRYSFDEITSPTGTYSILEADHIAIEADNVGAMHVRSIGLQHEGISEMSFPSNPYWMFTITSTTGRIDISKWTVGIHENRGHTNTAVATQWFISQ